MSKERRRFFRVNDVVNLRYRKIEPDELETRKRDFWKKDSEWNARNQFNRKIEEHMADFKIIQRDLPAVARYINMLQDQIYLINNKLANTEDWPEGHKKEVSISAQGIAFNVEQAFEPDESLDLEIQILPNGQTISIIARVISCIASNSVTEDRFYVSLDFENIHDMDQDILVKHNHALQLKSLSANRHGDV